MFTTTLNKIREHGPCTTGWTILLKGLGKTGPDDEPLAMSTILSINGLDDAIWCLRTLEGADREIRLFAVAVARQQQHLMTDPRSLAVLDVAERFANGAATEEELDAASDAARAAAYAAYAASAAARAAARAAAWAAADAARAAAYAAYAASAAARAAAWAAADAARAAAWAAASAEAMAKQEQLFKEHFG